MEQILSFENYPLIIKRIRVPGKLIPANRKCRHLKKYSQVFLFYPLFLHVLFAYTANIHFCYCALMQKKKIGDSNFTLLFKTKDYNECYNRPLLIHG